MVFRSDHLDQRKAKTLRREVEKEREELSDEAEALARRPFACAADAQAALDAWCREHVGAWHRRGGAVAEHQEREKRAHRGRPRKDETPVWLTSCRVEPQVGDPDEARLQAELS